MPVGIAILVVEDNSDIRVLVCTALKNAGYTVLVATNGEEGLMVMAEAHPDLVLLDVMMPVLNGIEFLEIKNQDPKLSQIPVIVTSANTNLPALTGSRCFIRKPIDLAKLLSQIAFLCGPPT